MAREARVNVMVQDHVKERLDTYAKSMGLSVSALCAYILGQYVYQQDYVMTGMMNHMGTSMDKFFEKMNENDGG